MKISYDFIPLIPFSLLPLMVNTTIKGNMTKANVKGQILN